MDDRTFEQAASIGATLVGVLSLLYAIAYLVITPSGQRGSDVDKFYRSYLAHPAGLRMAAACLLVSGLISGAVVVALIRRIRTSDRQSALSWAGMVAVAHVAPSSVDPRGLATFAAAGLVALAVGLAVRASQRRLGWLGVVLGADMVALFLANAVGIKALVLVTGGLASVVLGPVWWFGIGRLLWRPSTATVAAPAPSIPRPAPVLG